MKSVFYKISSVLFYFVGIDEEPLQKVVTTREDHPEHFKAIVVQKYPIAKIFQNNLNLNLNNPCAWKIQ